MDKSIDLLVYEYKQKLMGETNSSPLPLSVKSMVIKELFDAVTSVAEQQLKQEMEKVASAAEHKDADDADKEGV